MNPKSKINPKYWKRNVLLLLVNLTLLSPLSMLGQTKQAKTGTDDGGWQIRDDKFFFWDGQNQKLKQEFDKLTTIITALKKEKETTNLSLSLKDKEINQLKDRESKFFGASAFFKKRIIILQRENNHLQLRLSQYEKIGSNATKQLSQKFGDRSNPNTEDDIIPVRNSSEQKVADFLNKKRTITPTKALENEKKTDLEKEENKTISFSSISISASSLARNGVKTDAFLTDFYLMKEDINILIQPSDLSNEYLNLSIYELWCLATNDRKLFPGIASKLRRIILENCVKKVRTNSKGLSSFNDIEEGQYFILGMVPIGSIGTVWNIPINLDQPKHSISLTHNNAAWRK
tara:strand:+ start:1129 stop:2166 length:1038 start_codon:yes stop_codon:yes gene_type:complete